MKSEKEVIKLILNYQIRIQNMKKSITNKKITKSEFAELEAGIKERQLQIDTLINLFEGE